MVSATFNIAVWRTCGVLQVRCGTWLARGLHLFTVLMIKKNECFPYGGLKISIAVRCNLPIFE
jgi:hypothetical protein